MREKETETEKITDKGEEMKPTKEEKIEIDKEIMTDKPNSMKDQGIHTQTSKLKHKPTQKTLKKKANLEPSSTFKYRNINTYFKKGK